MLTKSFFYWTTLVSKFLMIILAFVFCFLLHLLLFFPFYSYNSRKLVSSLTENSNNQNAQKKKKSLKMYSRSNKYNFSLQKTSSSFQHPQAKQKPRKINIKWTKLWIHVITTSVVLGSCSLLCTNRKELSYNLEGHTLCFRDFQIDKNPRYNAHNCVHAKNTSKTNRFQHHRECIGDDNITYPKCQGTYCNAYSTNSGRKYLSAEYVWNRPKPHHKETEVKHNAHSWYSCM